MVFFEWPLKTGFTVVQNFTNPYVVIKKFSKCLVEMDSLGLSIQIFVIESEGYKISPVNETVFHLSGAWEDRFPVKDQIY